MSKHTDILAMLKPQIENYNSMVVAGIEPKQAADIAFPDLPQDIVRIDRAYFDELIKFAFLTGKQHSLMELSNQPVLSEEEAIRNCLKVLNSML